MKGMSLSAVPASPQLYTVPAADLPLIMWFTVLFLACVLLLAVLCGPYTIGNGDNE